MFVWLYEQFKSKRRKENIFPLKSTPSFPSPPPLSVNFIFKILSFLKSRSECLFLLFTIPWSGAMLSKTRYEYLTNFGWLGTIAQFNKLHWKSTLWWSLDWYLSLCLWYLLLNCCLVNGKLGQLSSKFTNSHGGIKCWYQDLPKEELRFKIDFVLSCKFKFQYWEG